MQEAPIPADDAERLASLRISLADAEALYARVLEVDDPSCLVRFTAVPPEARRVLERARPNG